MTSTRRSLALVALALTLAACSGDELPTLPSPSSAFPPESPAPASGPTGPSATKPTGATGASGLPVTSPAEGTGNLTAGQLRFDVSGELQVHKDLGQLISAVYTPPPGALAIVWTAGGTDASTVGIGGASFLGTQTTSPTLSLSLTAQTTAGIWSFLSMDGECDVTIGRAEANELSGSFTCGGLTGDSGVVVDVSATFEATG